MRKPIFRTLVLGLVLGGLTFLTDILIARDPSPTSGRYLANATAAPQIRETAASAPGWARTVQVSLGGNDCAYNQGHAVQPSSDGGIVVAGIGGFDGAFQADNGNFVMTGGMNNGMLVVSLDPNGSGGSCPLIQDASVIVSETSVLGSGEYIFAEE